MKKYMIILILIAITIIIFLLYPHKKEIKKTNYTFYKPELEDRYKLYKIRFPDLNEIDIITRVNLNLDKDFYNNTKEAKNLNTNYILVNKYLYLPKDYVPYDLEIITNCTSKDNYLVKEAKDNFMKLCEDIKKEDLNIRVISSYRPYEYQEYLYNNYVKEDGIKLADTYSARPGFSEHQTGLVIDIDNYSENYENFENTEEYNWMINNSYKYGFILRYPVGKENITGYNYESWHYRYVGKEIAEYIFNNNITLDEYYIRFIDK